MTATPPHVTAADMSDRARRLMRAQAPPSHDEFVKALYRELRSAIRYLEGMAEQLGGDGEEKITSILIASMRGFGFKLTAETRHRGHVDLTAHPELDESYQWLAEAKVFKGSYEKLTKGMKQLLGRYSSGRDPDAGMIVYMPTEKLVKRLRTWRQRVEADPVEACTSCKDCGDPFGFVSSHPHSSGSDVRVRHFWANLYFDPTDAD